MGLIFFKEEHQSNGRFSFKKTFSSEAHQCDDKFSLK
jgi:hypothetical protein